MGPTSASASASAVTSAATRDPEPLPPVEPALTDCCTSGCSPCIFDVYQDAYERWQAEHAAWLSRQPRPRG